MTNAGTPPPPFPPASMTATQIEDLVHLLNAAQDSPSAALPALLAGLPSSPSSDTSPMAPADLGLAVESHVGPADILNAEVHGTMSGSMGAVHVDPGGYGEDMHPAAVPPDSGYTADAMIGAEHYGAVEGFPTV